MAITLELTPEIEARLIAQAAAQGMTAEAFLKALIENLLNSEPPTPCSFFFSSVPFRLSNATTPPYQR